MKKCFICSLFIVCPILLAKGISADDDKLAVINQIKVASKKIENLHVKYTSATDTPSVSKETQESSIEWAFSGEKLFLKKQFQGVSKERFHLGLWDGKHYKLYDTYTKSGSVRNEYQPGANEDVPFNLRGLAYARFYGQFSGKSLFELFELAPLKLWDISMAEDGAGVSVTLNTIDGLISETWRMNPDKNYVVEEYDFVARGKNSNEYRVHVNTKAQETTEIIPGIWVPTKVTSSTLLPNKTTKQENFTVDVLKVNSSETEDLFTWTFPRDGQSTYYDYNISSAVIPHETEEILTEDLTLTAADMRARTHEESTSTLGIPGNVGETRTIETEPARNAAGPREKPHAKVNNSLWIGLAVASIAVFIVSAIFIRQKKSCKKTQCD